MFKPTVILPIVQMNGDVILALEAALADAKKGDITCLFIAAGMRGGGSSGCFIEGDGLLALLGEVEIVKGRAMDYIRDLNGSL